MQSRLRHGSVQISVALPVALFLAGPVSPTLAQAPDCADFPCGNNGNKVLVCHLPPGNPGSAHTICINPNMVSAHLANHGDEL